jgi:hypothetical protein
LIHRIIKGLFAKYITEEPNHGTLAPFIIRYRYIDIYRYPEELQAPWL